MADPFVTMRALLKVRTNNPPFSDDALDTFLKGRQTVERRARVLPLGPDRLVWASERDGWEDLAAETGPGVRFYSGADEITDAVDTWDAQTGTVTFTEPQAGVRIAGAHHDGWAACGDVLTAWASRVMLEFSFKDEGGQQFHRAEQHQMLLAQAAAAYAQASGTVGRMTQSDVWPSGAWHLPVTAWL